MSIRPEKFRKDPSVSKKAGAANTIGLIACFWCRAAATGFLESWYARTSRRTASPENMSMFMISGWRKCVSTRVTSPCESYLARGTR